MFHSDTGVQKQHNKLLLFLHTHQAMGCLYTRGQRASLEKEDVRQRRTIKLIFHPSCKGILSHSMSVQDGMECCSKQAVQCNVGSQNAGSGKQMHELPLQQPPCTWPAQRLTDRIRSPRTRLHLFPLYPVMFSEQCSILNVQKYDKSNRQHVHPTCPILCCFIFFLSAPLSHKHTPF